MASKYGNIAHLLNTNYKTEVTRWLAEDCPSFDYGGFVVGDAPTEAKLLGKSAGMLAGVPFFDEVFRQLDCTVDWHITEGTTFEPVKHCATVHGPVRKILLGERVALNTLARCSGIATASAHFLSLLRQAGSTATLAGTRKTTPAFRVPEKYAMLVGGIDGHRHDLSSMIMLKDNHVWACGSITAAVQAAKAVGGFSMKVEVECQNEAEAIEAIAAGADVVMLDNFAASEVGRAVRNLKERFNGFSMDERSTTLERKEFLVEISGGITVENVKMLGDTGVDIVSTSAVHQGVKHLDFSLKIVH